MVDGASVARKRVAANKVWRMAAKCHARPLARDAIRTLIDGPFDYTMMLRTTGGYDKVSVPVERYRVATGTLLRQD